MHKNQKTYFVDSVNDHRSFQIMLSFPDNLITFPVHLVLIPITLIIKLEQLPLFIIFRNLFGFFYKT